MSVANAYYETWWPIIKYLFPHGFQHDSSFTVVLALGHYAVDLGAESAIVL